MSISQEEIDAINSAWKELKPTKQTEPIVQADPTKFDIKELIDFCKQVISLMDKGIAKIANPNSATYFKGMKRYMEKEQLKAESGIDLVDKL